jgi:hypothetical protein
VVNCTYTIDATEKAIGELRALQLFASLPIGTGFTPAIDIVQDLKTKMDGGKDKIINGVKFSATIKLDLIDSELEDLFEIAQRGRPFYIYLAPISSDKTKLFFRVQDQYLVNMTNDAKPKLPQNIVDGVHWEVDMKVEQV